MNTLIENIETKENTENRKGKVLLLTIPAILVLGSAVITGGAWYSGQKIEEKYRQSISDANTFLRNLSKDGTPAMLEIERYERGLFSAESVLRLVIDANQEIKSKQKIYHGPLPLNQLVPAAASIESNVVIPREFRTFFDGENLLQGTALISFGGEVKGDYTFAKGQYSDGKDSIHSAPLVTSFRYNDQKKSGDLKIKLDDLTLNIDSNHMKLQGGEIALAFEPKQPYRYLGNGKLSVSLKQLDLMADKYSGQAADVNVSDLHFSENLVIKGDRLELEELGAIGKAVINGLNLGRFERAATIDVDANITDRLIQVFTPLAEFEDNDIDQAKAEALLEELFYKKPQLQLKKWLLENDKGKATLDALLTLNIENKNVFENPESALKAVSGSGINITLEQGYLEEAAKAFNMLSGKNLNSATVEAKRLTDMLFQEAQANGGEYVEIKDGRINLSLTVDQNDVVLNGKKLTQKEKENALLAVAMMGGNPFNGLENFNKAELEAKEQVRKQAEFEAKEKARKQAEFEAEEKARKQAEFEAEEKARKQAELEAEEKARQASQQTEQVTTPTISEGVSGVNLDAACQLKQGDDAIAFLQACLRSKPTNTQVQAVIEQAKNMGVCDVAQRLYANRGQNDGDIAFAYAQEYDPQTAGNNICFNANKNTAIYWYETAVELGKTEAVKRLQELKK